MESFPRYTFPSLGQMKLMAFINDNGPATFNDQKYSVYGKKSSFKIAVKMLIKINALKREQAKNWPFTCRYCLTDDGKNYIEGLKK